MTEVTPQPLKTQGFHNCLILLFYDHPAKAGVLFYYPHKGAMACACLQEKRIVK
ncbi:hypothetical protein [Intestinimonas sp. MSJ-38]|uniref:hypothetical protein n=1 Tax=Intestinimonas sp. MSJ-38 TaxID=2841532 RepID=UPI001C125AB0|nr:hypothetical protein [Intestinimonas sp. MSJ-38]MBU5433555.1 hypothetical protein [Intestinimonas sp. MSJ-38]